MGAPKLKHFPKKKLDASKQAELKKQNEKDKRDIELLGKTLQEKLQDPEVQKKAARVLEEIIKKKT